MQAGRMKSKIELLKPVSVANGYGETSIEYVPTQTVYAERVKMIGRRSDEVGEHFPDYSAQWNIRDAHEVDENWRVKEHNGHLYTVTNIVPNPDRGMLTLICERVNE